MPLRRQGVDLFQMSLRGERLLKAFFAVLTVGAFALIVGASAATSAPSREHLLVGYNHAPTAADRAAIASVGGSIRREFASIGALAVDLPSGKAASIRSQSGVTYVESGRSSHTAVAVGHSADHAARSEHHERAVRPRHDAHRRGAGRRLQGHRSTACVAEPASNAPSRYRAEPRRHVDVFSGKSGLHATDVYDLGVQKTETHATHVSGIVLNPRMASASSASRPARSSRKRASSRRTPTGA